MHPSVPRDKRIEPADVMPPLLVAFADDPEVRWLYPDQGIYGRALPELVLLSAGAAFDAGTVDVAEDGTAVAIWDPPGADRDPEEVSTAWGSHFQAHVDPTRLGDVFAWGEQTGQFHPIEPHWYLAMIAVTPERRGRGHGAALLRAGLERCERDGLPAYLASGNPRNPDALRAARLRGDRRDPDRGLAARLADAPSTGPRAVTDIVAGRSRCDVDAQPQAGRAPR